MISESLVAFVNLQRSSVRNNSKGVLISKALPAKYAMQKLNI